MEERKNVQLNSATEVEATRPEKMSYEQLENVAHQLSEQAKQLYMKLQRADMSNIFKRLDYLFKVVENAHAFSEEFTTKCVQEIEDLMTVPEVETETTEEK